MVKLKINPLSLIAFTLSSILLLLVQFGFISPVGYFEISYSQFIWLFWISVILFIVSTANLVVRIPAHTRWSTGYSGTIVRTVKIAGKQKDYFIEGASDTTIKEVLLENWPFDDQDKDSKWYVVDELGTNITNNPLSSLDGTATVIIENDTT